MQKYKHGMLDIESLGVQKNTVVISVGLVLFNPEDKDWFDQIDNNRCLYNVLNREEQLQVGRTIDQGTVDWWKQQSQEARNVFDEPQIKFDKFSENFKEALEGVEYLWGNGNTFDNIIMRDLFEDFNEQFPLHWTRDMDLRTLKLVSKSGKINIGHQQFTAHNALDDAKKQVLLAQSFWQSLHE